MTELLDLLPFASDLLGQIVLRLLRRPTRRA